MPIERIHRRRIYLDHNASSPLRPRAREAMLDALDRTGNPSSVHREGRAARATIEAARESIRKLVGARSADITFTSGATEANNWILRAGWQTIILADIEHDSVLGPAERSGANLVKLPVETSGQVRLGPIADHVLLGNRPIGRNLVTLQMANSETGVTQDVATAAAFCQAHDVVTHCDATQAPGRRPIDFDALGVDAMTISSHKIGGPAGVGCLVTKPDMNLPPAIFGGGQEMRRRAGTENVAAIAGFGAAAEAACDDLANVGALARLRNRLEAHVRDVTPDVHLIGAEADRLANTSCFALQGLKAETVVIKFDLAGVAISAGSACSSGKVGASVTLAAMGIDDQLADAAIRVSMGWTSSENDLEPFLTTWQRMATARR